MSSDSNIEWTDATWNPSTGCTKISEGCKHCYAAPMARRIQASEQARLDKLATRHKAALDARDGKQELHLAEQMAELLESRLYGAGFGFTEHSDNLDLMLAPLRWRKPRRVFTCSMSDLFHEQATDWHLACCWAVMAACPQHSFQVLTKRPHRMAAFLALLATPQGRTLRSRAVEWLLGKPEMDAACARTRKPDQASIIDRLVLLFGDPDNARPAEVPVLPNVWLGTSVENQAVTKDGWHPQAMKDGSVVPGRIDALLDCPAVVRFLSCEPLLGPLDLSAWVKPTLPVPLDECPESWDEFIWPDWVPRELIESILNFWSADQGRGPRAYLNSWKQQGAPPAGLKMKGRDIGDEWNTGRYWFCWNNCGRLIDNGGKANFCSHGTGGLFNYDPGYYQPIHWVIAGGESGHQARPCHPDWVRSLRDQCQAAGVAFFFKQWGEWIHGSQVQPVDGNPENWQAGQLIHWKPSDLVTIAPKQQGHLSCRFITQAGHSLGGGDPGYGGSMPSDEDMPRCVAMHRVGRKKAGRLLDGVEHSEYPEVQA